MSWIKDTLLMTVFLVMSSLANDGMPTLSIQESWADYFGGHEAIFHIALHDTEQRIQKLGWALSVGSRTVARGEVPVGEDHTATCSVKMPSVREGVVMDGILSVTALKQRSNGAVVALEKPIHIFGDNPYSEQRGWLKELDIVLFDPELKTAPVFEQAGIPFRILQNIEALAGVAGGILIIGEGLSFIEYPGLPLAMMHAAQAGKPVLCLAPLEGSFTIPGTQASGVKRPNQLCFRNTEVISELDKKLDDKAWPPHGVLIAREFALQSERQLVVGTVLEEGAGWPWFEMEFSDGIEMILCGVSVIDNWDTGPAPRYLLLRILQKLDSAKKEKEEKKS